MLHTDAGELRSRTVIVAGGHGAFEPKKMPGYDMTPWEGRGVHYVVGSKTMFDGKRVMIVGGGDSAVDWVINLLDTASTVHLVHRREGFRAHELTVGQVLEAADRGEVALHVPFQIREVSGNGQSSGCGCSIRRMRRTRSRSKSTRSCCSWDSRPRSGR